MRIAYFDCFSGISGDMTVAAFLDAGLSPKVLLRELAKLGIKGFKINISKTARSGIAGTKFDCDIKDEEHSRSLSQIIGLIKKSDLNSRVKSISTAIFYNIGRAESKVHGIGEKKDIRLHELGSIDSIVDIISVGIAIDTMGIDEFYASDVSIGRASVKSAHGQLPIPAPAAMELLRGVPLNITETAAEMVTPTGAGILKTLVKKFGKSPTLKVDRIGYGAGTRDPKDGLPNMLRVIIGESEEAFKSDSIYVIETNIDDSSPQGFGYLFEKLFKAGALDAYITNIQMKKSRPAFKLTVLAHVPDLDRVGRVIFSETTTIGLRYYRSERLKLDRKTVSVRTSYGKVAVKMSEGPGGIMTASPEYDECIKIARKSGASLRSIYDEARSAAKG